MSLYTVFGGRGFIGSEFVKQLKEQGHKIFIPERNDINIYTKDLGIVIYSAGYGDCQNDPFNVFEANVSLLSRLLQNAQFEKLIYISSTRVYMNQNESLEYSDITVCNEDNRRLFNLTKLMAEELCLKSNRECLIIRPSNVFGLALNSPLFLPSITRNAITNSHIDMYIDKKYSKDYIYVSDLVKATLQIIKSNRNKNNIINIASGKNTNAIDIANVLKKETGCNVSWHIHTQKNEIFPIINIDEMLNCIDFKLIDVISALSNMIFEFKRELKSE